MTARTPAQTLRAAANLLRERATAADAINPGPWERRRTHPDLPDSDFYRLWAADRSAVLHGGRPFVLGPIAQYITAMHPGVGRALAEWLDDAADGDEHGEHTPYALAVARQLLAEVTG